MLFTVLARAFDMPVRAVVVPTHVFVEMGTPGGKVTEIEHDGRTLFAGLPNPLTVGRYHSLIADPDLPGELELSASCDGTVMAVRHSGLPAEGVQFHPESVLTPAGKQMLANFLGLPAPASP